MKRYILLIALCMTFVIPMTLQAEDECDTDNLKASIQAQLDRFNEEPLAALAEILSLAVHGMRGCSKGNYNFSSATEGLHPVLGPLALEAGIYQFTLTTERAGIVKPTPLTDACGSDLEKSILNISAGQGEIGAESLVVVEGKCQVYLELTNLREDWTLSIEKLR